MFAILYTAGIMVSITVSWVWQ